MHSGCFGCDAVIEAEDAATIADRFVAHAAESHDWAFPEEALRNYARNFAEAKERLTGNRTTAAIVAALERTMESYAR